MTEGPSQQPGRSGERGYGFMEVMIGILLTLILGFILIHLLRLGYAMYQLNSTSRVIAEELEKARSTAIANRQGVAVLFQSSRRRFGVDLNNNGRLDTIEAKDLPEGVSIAEDLVISFNHRGSLVSSAKAPEIVVSNHRDSRSIVISSLGIVEID